MSETQIQINDMHFNALHGCYPEERIVGNHYTVQLLMLADTSKAELSDCIDDTANYHRAYELVAEQMEVPSNLLEHVARRIVDAILKGIPQANAVQVTVAKHNPPMGGKIHSVSVTLERRRNAE